MDTWTHIFFTKYYSTTRSTAGSVCGYRPWIQRANYKCPHTGDCMESCLWLLDCTRGNCIAGITLLILCWEICSSVEGDWARISCLVMSLSHYAAAKSLQSCPTLCNTIEDSPPGSAVPAILQARTLEWVAISFSNAWKWKVKVKSLSCVRLVATPWTAASQAPPSMGVSRQEYWSGVPSPSPVSLWHKDNAVLMSWVILEDNVLNWQYFFPKYLLEFPSEIIEA